MADTVSEAVRSMMMAGIKGKNTKPEMVLRRGLHSLGFRFRLHARDLPGRPDIVLPRYKAVVFAHGCFWHGHDCPLFRLPATRTEFWQAKIEGNRVRDLLVEEKLLESSWRVMTVWECAIRGPGRLPLQDVLDRCAAWLRTGDPQGVIRSLS